MEGVLWKWTNYWNGWQQRWFILDKGILTYYKSQEEVNQGCKGSVKVSACEIVVHQTDPKRLDLVIQSEQHFYLRAATAQERQQWLVALGSSKAAHQLNAKSGADPALPGGVENSVRMKKSELRLYCDLLMQQVHTIKTSADGDVDRMSQAADLLRATCDTFIATLEDCMRLADANFTYELPHQEVRDSALPHEAPAPVAPLVPKSLQGGHHQASRRASGDKRRRSTPTSSLSTSGPPSGLRTNPDEPPPVVALSNVSNNHWTSPDDLTVRSDKPDSGVPFPTTTANGNPPGQNQVRTFFSTMDLSFVDLPIHGTSIPAEPFLDCCRSVLPVFDMLSATAFAPVKMDIQGNINKLQSRCQASPSASPSDLLSLVRHEMASNTTAAKNSATDALLWLKRALAFILNFLEEIRLGNTVLSECANIAYSHTLKAHHGWVVRSVFAVALRVLPELDAFIEALAPSLADFEHPDYKRQLMVDCAAYVDALRRVLDVLDDFYVQHDLESPMQRR